MKARILTTKLFSAASMAALETDVNDWLGDNADEAEYVDARFSVDGGTFYLVLILAGG